MILLNVYYKTKPGMREAFYDKVCNAKVPELSRAEEGNIKYDYFFSDTDKDLLLLVEHWKDSAAFSFHKEQEHFQALGLIKEEFILDVQIDNYEV